MTFDEALLKWRIAQEMGPATVPFTANPFTQVSDDTYIRQQYDTQIFKSIIADLRRTYEPKVWEE